MIMHLSFARQGLATFDPVALDPSVVSSSNNSNNSNSSTTSKKKKQPNLLFEIADLDCSFNALSLCSDFQLCSQLIRLDLSHNRICSLKLLPLRLRFLNVSHNSLKTLDGAQSLIHLDTLLCSHNQLTTLEHVPAQSLRTLDVAHNNIVSLRDLDGCSSLIVVRAEHNMLRQPKDIEVLASLPSLCVVALASNAVCGRPEYVTALARIVQRVEDVDVGSAQHALIKAQQVSSPISSPKSPLNVSKDNIHVASPNNGNNNNNNSRLLPAEDFFAPATNFLTDTVAASKRHAEQLLQQVDAQIATERGRLELRPVFEAVDSVVDKAATSLTPEQRQQYQRPVVELNNEDVDEKQQQHEPVQREISFGYQVLPRPIEETTKREAESPEPRPTSDANATTPSKAKKAATTAPRFSVTSTRRTPQQLQKQQQGNSSPRRFGFLSRANRQKEAAAAAEAAARDAKHKQEQEEQLKLKEQQQEEEAAKKLEQERKQQEQQELRILELKKEEELIAKQRRQMLNDASQHYDHLDGALAQARLSERDFLGGPQHFIAVTVTRHQQPQSQQQQQQRQQAHTISAVHGNVISSRNPYSSSYKTNSSSPPHRTSVVHRATESRIRTLSESDRKRSPIDLPMPIPLIFIDGTEVQQQQEKREEPQRQQQPQNEHLVIQNLARTALRSETCVAEDKLQREKEEREAAAAELLQSQLEMERLRREALERELEDIKAKAAERVKNKNNNSNKKLTTRGGGANNNNSKQTRPDFDLEKHREKTLTQIRASAFRRSSAAGAAGAGVDSAAATRSEALARADKVLANAAAVSSKGDTIKHSAVVKRRLSAFDKRQLQQQVAKSKDEAASKSTKQQAQKQPDELKQSMKPAEQQQQAQQAQQQQQHLSPSAEELALTRLRLQDTVSTAIQRMTQVTQELKAHHPPSPSLLVLQKRHRDPMTQLASNHEQWADEQRSRELQRRFDQNCMGVKAPAEIIAIQQRAAENERLRLEQEREAKLEAKRIGIEEEKQRKLAAKNTRIGGSRAMRNSSRRNVALTPPKQQQRQLHGSALLSPLSPMSPL